MENLTPCYTVGGLTYKTGQNDAVICNFAASGYRLPTEAEWEKAARGGLSGKLFPWGDTISQSQANYRVYSGAGIGMVPTRQVCKAIRAVLFQVRTGWAGAADGAASHTVAVQRSATTSTRRSATMTLGSASPAGNEVKRRINFEFRMENFEWKTGWRPSPIVFATAFSPLIFTVHSCNRASR